MSVDPRNVRRAFGHVAPELPHHGARLDPSPMQAGAMPARVSLLDVRGPTLDQETVGSCVMNATSAASALLGRRVGEIREDSPLALYYAVRQRRGSLDADGGSTIADALRVAEEFGLYPLASWPNDPRLFLPPGGPPPDFAEASSRRRVVNWEPLAHDLVTLRWTLFSGYPVIAGIRTFDTFSNDAAWSTGRVAMPSRESQSVGGHAILLVGYDDTTSEFVFQNSWGPFYGENGVGRIPQPYITDPFLCTEIAAVRAVRSA